PASSAAGRAARARGGRDRQERSPLRRGRLRWLDSPFRTRSPPATQQRPGARRASPPGGQRVARRRADAQGDVDGQTITIDYLSADGQGERFPALARERLQFMPDIIVVTTTPAAQSAKNATRTLPIVTIPLGDPVATGLVASL